jgi:hypothetical protein
MMVVVDWECIDENVFVSLEVTVVVVVDGVCEARLPSVAVVVVVAAAATEVVVVG